MIQLSFADALGLPEPEPAPVVCLDDDEDDIPPPRVESGLVIPQDLSPASYRVRYRLGQLIPGEKCPGCGTVMRGRYDGGRMHQLRTDGMCWGMWGLRRHLHRVIRDGVQKWAKAEITRTHMPTPYLTPAVHYATWAIDLGWPEETVQGWLLHPEQLAAEVVADE